jgi:hypothetical protein
MREHQSGDMASTVDVLAGPEEITQHLEYCRIHGADYGSDHRPLTLSYLRGTPRRATQRRKRLCKDANWAEIRISIGRQSGDGRSMKKKTSTTVFGQVAGVFVKRHQRYARGTSTSGKAVPIKLPDQTK